MKQNIKDENGNRLMKILTLLAGIDVGDDPVTICLLGDGQVQLQYEGYTPTNYDFSEEDIAQVYGPLEDLMVYNYKDEEKSYMEWMSDQGIEVEIDKDKVNSEGLNKGHIFYNVQLLRELLKEFCQSII